MRKSYSSDISRKQFEKIKPLLLSTRKSTCPRELDLYDVFCEILYLIKSGCQWRMLPSDFPNWCSIYSYFRIWSEKKENRLSLLDQALKKIMKKWQADLLNQFEQLELTQMKEVIERF